MRNKRTEIVIVGRGFGGLALAAALRARATDCRIQLLEEAKGPPADRFGMALAPNGIAALAELGLVEAVAERASPISGVEVRSFKAASGACFDYQRLVGPRACALGVLPSHLRRAFEADLTRDVEIHWDHRFVGLEHDANGRTYVLTQGPNELRRDVADIVVGADGVNSRVRRYVDGDRRPRASREAYQLIVAGRMEGLTTVRHYLAPGKMLGVVPIGREHTFVFWLVPRGAVTRVDEPLEAFKARLLACEPALEPALIPVVAPSQVSRADISLFHASRWSSRNVVLLGDSLHTYTPALAQGVNSSLVDAVTLAGLVDDWIRAGSDPQRLASCFERYRRMRSVHTRIAYHLSWLFSHAVTMRLPLVCRSRVAALRLLAASPAAAPFLRTISGMLPANRAFQASRIQPLGRS